MRHARETITASALAGVLIIWALAVPSSVFAQTSTDIVPPGAMQRVQLFVELLAEEKHKQAFENITRPHPRPEAMAAVEAQGVHIFETMTSQLPIDEVVLVGVDEFAGRLVRFSYLIDQGFTGHAMVIVMYRHDDNWVMDSFCVENDLKDATAAGRGILVCSQ